ncbi:MAG: hypothetical protein KIS79_08330 [Burkholderiales bacterium]|nr:hypothetical protein [Burkholderiales bacterium]
MLQTQERRTHLGRRASDLQREQELSMLRTEVEMLMTERDHLLRTAGAAAMFVAKLDTHVLPENTYEAADILAKVINTLPEETLKDAVESVRTTYGETLGDKSARMS